MTLVQNLTRVSTLVRTAINTISRSQPTAIETLVMDHIKVELLFLLVRSSQNPSTKMQILQMIKNELEAHMRIEEKLFYQACAKFVELREIVQESYVEHGQVKTLLHEITNANPQTDSFAAQLKVLMENVRHHVTEEESDLFPKILRLMSKPHLKRLGGELQTLRKATLTHRVKTRRAA